MRLKIWRILSIFPPESPKPVLCKFKKTIRLINPSEQARHQTFRHSDRNTPMASSSSSLETSQRETGRWVEIKRTEEWRHKAIKVLERKFNFHKFAVKRLSSSVEICWINFPFSSSALQKLFPITQSFNLHEYWFIFRIYRTGIPSAVSLFRGSFQEINPSEEEAWTCISQKTRCDNLI